MARFHINDKTGEPGPCRAKKECPFGDLQTEHFDSKDEARRGYEQKMQAQTVQSFQKPKPTRQRVKLAAVGMTLVASFSLAGCNTQDIRSQDAPVAPVPSVQEDAPPPAPVESPDDEYYDEVYEEMKSRVKEDAREALDGAKDEVRDGLSEMGERGGELLDGAEEKGREATEKLLKELDERYSEETEVEEPPSGQSADVRATLDTLEIKGRAPMTGYDRDAFMSGSQWEKARQGVLQRDFTNVVYRDDGKVFSGDLDDPYTGSMIHYEIGGPSEVDVDHVVSLGNAWASGAQYQDESIRLAIATDPRNLLAVDSGANRQKGDSNAASWLPANKSYRCEYLSTQVAVKAEYDLWVTQSEYDAIVDGLNKWC